MRQSRLVELALRCHAYCRSMRLGGAGGRERAEVDAYDLLAFTALHYAARWGDSVDVAKLLTDNGANKNAKDEEGRKPKDYSKFFEMFQLLGGQDRSGKRP